MAKVAQSLDCGEQGRGPGERSEVTLEPSGCRVIVRPRSRNYSCLKEPAGRRGGESVNLTRTTVVHLAARD
jgi:hypothetical protein